MAVAVSATALMLSAEKTPESAYELRSADPMVLLLTAFNDAAAKERSRWNGSLERLIKLLLMR